ncbi:MAG: T9SS-dependent M36 family metallopeptidase [Saprospiraceae bacterium]|nr:T9SS-dependent M36 family metallopeptidase [Saprospiraceae bacterium]
MAKPFFLVRATFLLALLALCLPARAQQFQPEIKTYLQNVKPDWNLTDDDISDWTVSDQYANRKTGVTYTYLHQQISGIRIYNAVSTMAIRNGKVEYFANRFYPDAAHKANTTHPSLPPETAIQLAAAQLGVALGQAPQQQSKDENRHRMTFNDCGISDHPVQVELLFVPDENTFRLAWNVSIALRESADWWNVRVDALTGEFISKNNWTVSCDPGSGYSRNGSATMPGPGILPDQFGAGASSYNVFALPVEAPNFGQRSLVSDPGSAIASPFGWHDTDGADGADYTITRGNNVYAYEDRNDADVPGYSPDGGANLQFDFPLDLTQDPEVNQDAVITNLFYVNNMMHDILYVHGFDEEAGNFQENNYGKGGMEADQVLAEAQDGGGTSNANFSTPEDGFNGTMQMYLWPSGAPSILTVHTPVDIAADYNAMESTFGPGLTAPVTSDVILVNDGVGTTSDGCEPIVNTAEISGKIAVMDRGTCTFVSKVSAAEDAGAIAVIVINNTGGAPFAMTGGGNIGIPSVMISQADGNLIKAKLAAGEKVNVTLASSGVANVDRDGSLDNGIVAHEYGHGLSIRLTGGPSNSNCLDNNEQGGEGWSDWLALIMTIEPGDAGADARPIGTYALADTSGDGIRRHPYSTDMSVNPQIYSDLAGNTEVHAIGEIWSQVLWDMTWKLIDEEGFNADWYNGTGGNITALNLVIEAMKLQPCGPGYLDARDAILAADKVLYDNAHRCLIWEAFARRGMGADAKQGSANVAGDETAGFELPTFCQIAVQPPVAEFTVDVTTTCFGTFQFTDKSVDIPQNWLWNFGDGATSTDINPSHTYATPGVYTVNLTVTNTLGTDDFSLVVKYETLATPVISGNTNICAGDSVALTADASSGSLVQWSTGGNIVFTGTAFNSPALQNSTTYNVQQVENKPVGHVGPLDNTIGNGNNHNTNFEGRILFEAYVPFRLLSVLVIAQGDGDRTIRLYNEAGSLLQEVVVFVPDGSSRIDLNMDIPAAGKYSIGNAAENLYRNTGGVSYPYTLANIVQLYNSNAPNGSQNRYYYFYDWEVQEIGCSSVPATVTVNVSTPLLVNFTATPDKLDVAFADVSTGSPTTWSWNFGDGSPLSTEPNPTHVYASPGTYTVTLTASNICSSGTYQLILTVTDGTIGTHLPAESFGLKVFPNPAGDQTRIDIYRTAAGPVSLDLTDAVGRLILGSSPEITATGFTLRTSALVPGVYYIRISAEEGSVVRKLTVMR